MNISTQEKEKNTKRLISEILKYWEDRPFSKKEKLLPTQKFLAEKCQLNIRTVKRHWQELIDHLQKGDNQIIF